MYVWIFPYEKSWHKNLKTSCKCGLPQSILGSESDSEPKHPFKGVKRFWFLPKIRLTWRLRGCINSFPFKSKPSAFSSSSYSETKINHRTRCILLSNPHHHHHAQQKSFYSVVTWGIEVWLREVPPLFPEWSRKSKRGERLGNPNQHGDKMTYAEQDPGFAPEFKIIIGFLLFDSLQAGGERGRRMGRASWAFTAARLQLGDGWITGGLASHPPTSRRPRASLRSGRADPGVGPGRGNTPARIPGARTQPRPGSPILFPRSPARRRRLYKQPSSAC